MQQLSSQNKAATSLRFPTVKLIETEIVRIVQATVGIIDMEVTTFCPKTVFPGISAGLKPLNRKHWTNSKQSPLHKPCCHALRVIITVA